MERVKCRLFEIDCPKEKKGACGWCTGGKYEVEGILIGEAKDRGLKEWQFAIGLGATSSPDAFELSLYQVDSSNVIKLKEIKVRRGNVTTTEWIKKSG